MGELVRSSRRFVLCGEYHSDEPVEVPYRGALFKRDWGALFASLVPDVHLLDGRFEGRETSWDDVTFWLFTKVSPDDTNRARGYARRRYVAVAALGARRVTGM